MLQIPLLLRPNIYIFSHCSQEEFVEALEPVPVRPVHGQSFYFIPFTTDVHYFGSHLSPHSRFTSFGFTGDSSLRVNNSVMIRVPPKGLVGSENA